MTDLPVSWGDGYFKKSGGGDPSNGRMILKWRRGIDTSLRTMMPTQKNFDQLLIFVIMYHHAKKQFTVYVPSVHSSFFNHAYPKNSLSSLNLCEIVPVCKKWVPSVLSWATINFRFQRPDWPHSFLTMPHQGLSSQLLMFVNLYQHAKNEAVS